MAIPTTGKAADVEFRRWRGRRAAEVRNSLPNHVRKVREIVDRTRAEQGLPPTVTDALTLQKVADVLRLANPDTPDAA